MGLTRTYDQNQVLLTVNFVPITGFMGSVVAAYEGEDWTHTNGSHGEVVRSRNHNDVGTITFSLQKGVDANAYLSSLAATDRLTALGQVTVNLQDLLGEDLASIKDGSFVKIPDLNLERVQITKNYFDFHNKY